MGDDEQEVCANCGAIVPAPAAYCSAGHDLVCQGRAPVPGCGAVLTAEEMHWYGDCCEQCERDWNDRIELWRHGGKDDELDRMFDTRPQPH